MLHPGVINTNSISGCYLYADIAQSSLVEKEQWGAAERATYPQAHLSIHPRHTDWPDLLLFCRACLPDQNDPFQARG